MKKYDCFTFFNEEEMLKIRLHELYYTVEKFLVVEGDLTFTGRPKHFYLDDILEKDWIQPFKDKIVRCRVGMGKVALSVGATSWRTEIYQRNHIKHGLEKLIQPEPDDLIVISDADEIPRAYYLGDIHVTCQLDVTQYFWNFNWQVPQHCNQGARPVVTFWKDLKETTPQELRESTDLPRLSNMGWHFSFFTDPKETKTKIEAFAHTEYDKDTYKLPVHTRYRIEHGIDPFDRFPLKWTEIDETYPKYVQENY